MKFDVSEVFLSQFMLMFVTVVLGLMFGKIRFGKFNFGVSGGLFIGLVIGYLAYSFALSQEVGSGSYAVAQKVLSEKVVSSSFFDLFLIIFLCAVGLLAAKDIGVVLREYGVKFVFLGLAVTFAGAAITYAITLASKDSNPYEVSGVYTGALSSSPGLAAAMEAATDHATERSDEFAHMNEEDRIKYLNLIGIKDLTSEEIATFEITSEIKEQFIEMARAGVGVGHTIGYPFSIFIIIVFINMLPAIFRIDVAKEKELYRQELQMSRENSSGSSKKAIKEIKETKFDMIAFIFVCAAGYALGSFNIKLPLIGYFNLGSTGGVLIAALIFGHIGKVGFMNFRMDTGILAVVRDIGLAFFLAIVGLRYGYDAVNSLGGSGLYLAITSVVVAVLAMVLGFIIGRYMFKLKWPILSGVICGGMTSTPGLGAAVESLGSDDPAAGYSATYPFGLLGMVLFSIILHKLPM